MWPLLTKMLLHGSVEGPTNWDSATIWNSRATEVEENLGSSGPLARRGPLARTAQRRGWSIDSWPINSWQITGRSGGWGDLDEQEFSEGTSRCANAGNSHAGWTHAGRARIGTCPKGVPRGSPDRRALRSSQAGG